MSSEPFNTKGPPDHMQPGPPPEYPQNDAQAPTSAPPLLHHERTLPPLPAINAELRHRPEPEPEEDPWVSLNPLTAYYRDGPAKLPPKEAPSAQEIAEKMRREEAAVREAAEALGNLKSSLVHSPRHDHTSPPPFGEQQPPIEEPLLSLLTTSHPYIGSAISGSMSAYSASKNYSPSLKWGAEYVEQKVTPVVNTVGTVGRMTGVEGGVRWFLSRRPSHHQPSESEGGGSHKRRKVGTSENMGNTTQMSYSEHRHELEHRPRRTSQSSIASLPAYHDDYMSPSYEATQQTLVTTQGEPPSPSNSWQSRLVLSTSGLSVAMSPDNLRRLKYCLGMVRHANELIAKIVLALKGVLERYDQDSGTASDRGWTYPTEANQAGQLVALSDVERSALDKRVGELKIEVSGILKQAVDTVSKYAGGALPENAKALVKKHLTSLPQKFRIASANSISSGEGANKKATDSAKRVMVLAKEGLDMMVQVSDILDGTIVSAEEWCEKLGRSKQGEMSPPPIPTTANNIDSTDDKNK